MTAVLEAQNEVIMCQNDLIIELVDGENLKHIGYLQNLLKKAQHRLNDLLSKVKK